MRLEYVEAAKLVLGNRGISTERGQMAYITETKLGLDVPKESGSCKVGAVLNEPVTQKVGKQVLRVQDRSGAERDEVVLCPAKLPRAVPLAWEIGVGRDVGSAPLQQTQEEPAERSLPASKT